jgi:hypothetical protein
MSPGKQIAYIPDHHLDEWKATIVMWERLVPETPKLAAQLPKDVQLGFIVRNRGDDTVEFIPWDDNQSPNTSLHLRSIDEVLIAPRNNVVPFTSVNQQVIDFFLNNFKDIPSGTQFVWAE